VIKNINELTQLEMIAIALDCDDIHFNVKNNWWEYFSISSPLKYEKSKMKRMNVTDEMHGKFFKDFV